MLIKFFNDVSKYYIKILIFLFSIITDNYLIIMGNMNTNTNLNINHYFEDDISFNNKFYYIKVILSPPAKGNSGEIIDHFYIRINGKEMQTLKEIKDNDKEYKYFEFEPKSHMRDFEFIFDYDLDIKVARGQGIGVIIIDGVESYVKLMYDKNNENGFNVASYNIWNKSQKAINLLNNDLSIGYNVLLIDSKDKAHNLCEKLDERDNRETFIIFKEYEKYAKYEH